MRSGRVQNMKLERKKKELDMCECLRLFFLVEERDTIFISVYSKRDGEKDTDKNRKSKRERER